MHGAWGFGCQMGDGSMKSGCVDGRGGVGLNLGHLVLMLVRGG